ncbi:MAG TPA: hypothetical protein VG845_04455, partial [Dehalococcoidia bacterium]|nr:hypothetical protein [Dehalococcoidia bacterium]
TIVPPVAEVLTPVAETVVPPVAEVLTPVAETVVPPVVNAIAPVIDPVLPGSAAPAVTLPAASQPTGGNVTQQTARPSVIAPPAAFDSETASAVRQPAAQTIPVETPFIPAYFETITETSSVVTRGLSQVTQTSPSADDATGASSPVRAPADVTSWINGVFSSERLSSSWSGGLAAVLLSALVLFLTPVIAAAANVALPAPRSPAYAPVYPPD